MSRGRLYRVAGVALVVGGALGVLAGLLAPSGGSVKDVVASRLFYPAATGTVVAGVLTMVSWPALYARQHRESGWLGFGATQLRKKSDKAGRDGYEHNCQEHQHCSAQLPPRRGERRLLH